MRAENNEYKSLAEITTPVPSRPAAWGGRFYFMPYSNVPDDLQGKMEICVQQVQEQGHDKESAIAICYARIVKEMEKETTVLERIMGLFKQGARHSKPDQEMLQVMHDNAVKLGAECSGFKIIEEKDGGYRWFGWVSNKYRDRDYAKHPRGEIITDAAHKEFVAHLDAHPEDAPEWWTWHTPVRKSRADWWDYANGFLVMSGPATAEDSKSYAADEELGMSHGFRALARNTAQGLITKYRSFEISDLPRDVAANPYTDFELIRKELSAMPFDAKKREYLVSKVGEDKVKELEGRTDELSKALAESGVEWKDTGLAPEAAPPDVAELMEAIKSALNVDELAQALAMLRTQNETLAGQVKALTDDLAALKKSDDEKVAETIAPKVKPMSWGFRPSTAESTKLNETEKAKADKAKPSWVQEVWGDPA